MVLLVRVVRVILLVRVVLFFYIYIVCQKWLFARNCYLPHMAFYIFFYIYVFIFLFMVLPVLCGSSLLRPRAPHPDEHHALVVVTCKPFFRIIYKIFITNHKIIIKNHKIFIKNHKIFIKNHKIFIKNHKIFIKNHEKSRKIGPR